MLTKNTGKISSNNGTAALIYTCAKFWHHCKNTDEWKSEKSVTLTNTVA